MSLLGYLKSLLPAKLELQVVPAKNIRIGDMIRLGDDNLTVIDVRNAVKQTKSSPNRIVIESKIPVVAQNGMTMVVTRVYSFKPAYGIRVWRSDRG